jgi:hypothetical protein
MKWVCLKVLTSPFLKLSFGARYNKQSIKQFTVTPQTDELVNFSGPPDAHRKVAFLIRTFSRKNRSCEM